ncbi:hypothetical protein ACFS07_06350 [Undibacterium arcticum]
MNNEKRHAKTQTLDISFFSIPGLSTVRQSSCYMGGPIRQELGRASPAG